MGRGRGRGRGGDRGRGEGRGEGGGGGGGGFEDQYGEASVSQDRDSFSTGGRGGGRGAGGMTGGGDAGGGKRDSNLTYIRHVPKFLQAHSHLLGKKSEDDPALEPLAAKRPREGSDGSDGDEDEEALQRAVAEDPSLAQQHPELAAVVAKGAAAQEKEKGNAAFAAKRFEDAVASFSKCIALDPRNEVFHSNRAAALTALRRYAEALADGRAATALKPGWAKGWARVGAAYTGLEEHAEACGAFERALELEPDDRGLQEARHSADVAARKAQAERRHRFKRPLEHGGAHGGRAGAGRVKPSEARAGVKLSFDADDDGG